MEEYIVCNKCGGRTRKNSNSQLYCPCCAYRVKLEKAKRLAHKKRMEKEGTLGPHPILKRDGSINIRAEQKAIRKEMERLGLRRKNG